jgi:cation-transporting ATPase E
MANVERVASLFVIKNVYSGLLALAVSVARLPYPFLPRHLTIVSGLTIGIPAFLFALAPNTRRYEPGFLRRVLTFSVPTGAIAAVGIFVGYVVARAQNIPRDQARAAATVVVMVIGLWVLVLLARPLAGWKLALVATMAGLFAIAMVTPVGRKQFALAAPTVCLLSSIAIGAGAAALVTVVWKRSTVSKLTAVVPAKSAASGHP